MKFWAHLAVWKANPFRWPLAWRVPVIVVLLMLSVSVVVTDRVLTRLAETQTRHLTQLSDAYLDGLSSAILPHVVREDVWEVYDALDRARQRYRGLDMRGPSSAMRRAECWRRVTRESSRCSLSCRIGSRYESAPIRHRQ